MQNFCSENFHEFDKIHLIHLKFTLPKFEKSDVYSQSTCQTFVLYSI